MKHAFSLNHWLLVILSLALLAACSSKDKTPETASKKDVAAPLADGAYVLTVQEAWDRNREAPPADPLKYVPVTDKKEYGLALSADQNEVILTHAELAEPVKGRRVKQEEKVWTYRLKEGLMAGGDLFIRFDGATPQAQLDILGSGVPLISSERGPLQPKK